MSSPGERSPAPRAAAPDTRLLRPPAGGPAHTGSSSGSAHSPPGVVAPPCVSGPHLPLHLSGCVHGLLVMFAPLPAPWPCPLPPVPLEALPPACCYCLLCPSPCFNLVSAHVLPSLPCPPELGLQRALSLQAPPVKEGPLFIHRTKGKGPLMSSFKKLHFCLTTEALSFAKTPNSKVGEEGGGQAGAPWRHLSLPWSPSQGPLGSENKAGQDPVWVAATVSLKTHGREASLPQGPGVGGQCCSVSPGFLVHELGGGLRGASGKSRN